MNPFDPDEMARLTALGEKLRAEGEDSLTDEDRAYVAAYMRALEPYVTALAEALSDLAEKLGQALLSIAAALGSHIAAADEIERKKAATAAERGRLKHDLARQIDLRPGPAGMSAVDLSEAVSIVELGDRRLRAKPDYTIHADGSITPGRLL